MAHEWFWGAIAGETWHNQQEERGYTLHPGTSVEEGIQKSRLSEIVWRKASISFDTAGGRRVLPDSYVLVRDPVPWVEGDDYYALNRVVTNKYQLVQGYDIADMAKKVALATGWQFKGAASLKSGEIVFAQLELDRDFRVGGLKHERHKTMFFWGDDKRSGSGFGGEVHTRMQCWNTWMAALSENGVFTIPHDGDPLAMWSLVNARVVEAYQTQEEEEEWLNRFFVKNMGYKLFQEFIEEVYPKPDVPQSVQDGIEAEVLLQSGADNGFGEQLKRLIEKGRKATDRHQQAVVLVERRQEHMDKGWHRHNDNFKESKETFYAGLQALTNTTTRGPFRGQAGYRNVFGIGEQFNTKGMQVLKEMYGG